MIIIKKKKMEEKKLTATDRPYVIRKKKTGEIQLKSNLRKVLQIVGGEYHVLRYHILKRNFYDTENYTVYRGEVK